MRLDRLNAHDQGPPHAASALSAAGSLAILRAAVIFLAVVVAGALVRFFSDILSPLVVATFLLLLIDSVSRGLDRRFTAAPRWARGAVAGSAILAGFSAIVLLFAIQEPPFAREILSLEPHLDGALAQLMGLIDQPPMTLHDFFAGGDPTHVLAQLFSTARSILSYAVLVIVYLGFLVASRQAFSSKIDRLYDTEAHRDQARRVFGSIRNAVEQYVRLQTFKAVLIGLFVFAVMSVLGVKAALFTAFLVFLAAFVPIIGAFAGAVFPALVTLAQFGSLLESAVLLAGLGLGVFLIDNVLMPKLQGDELNIDPLLVLISIGVWGLILGPPGVLLSTPLTVTVMAVAAEFQGTRWLAVLISKDGEPVKEASER